MQNLSELLRMPGASIVDVRTPAEFMGGHVAGSLNIPLNEIPSRLEELKGMGKPLILCCASGNRSGQAQHYLAAQGVTACFNGGPWTQVNYHLNALKA